MMKRMLVLACVATMVMGLASMASAVVVDTDWAIQLRAINGTTSQGTITLGTKATAGDAFTTTGAEDSTFASPTSGYAEISCTNGGTTRINKDYRAPVVPGAFKTWDLVMGINGGTPGTIKLIGWMPSASLVDATSDVVVKLYQGSTLLWTFAKGVSGSSLAPNYDSSKGLNFEYTGTPISLSLVASVPEPGSMLAMLSGLVGLVGYGVRRRK